MTEQAKGAAGVTITLGGAATRTTTTDASGHYQFDGLADGSYTVTPGAVALYQFAPAGSQTVTVKGADATQDFVLSFNGPGLTWSNGNWDETGWQ